VSTIFKGQFSLHPFIPYFLSFFFFLSPAWTHAFAEDRVMLLLLSARDMKGRERREREHNDRKMKEQIATRA